MMTLNNIVSSISEADKIAILPHVSADGDALGSSLALGLALKKAGKEVTVFLEEEIPLVYDFLPASDMVKVYGNEPGDTNSTEDAQHTDNPDYKHFDIIVALDSGDLGRLGKRAGIFGTTDNTVNIDHHQTNTEFAALNYVDTQSAAVGEIVYRLLKMMDVNLDPDISECLYVAVATDTGGFKYSNTTAVTHQIAADLINNGIDIAGISQKIFDSNPLSKVKLTGEAINSLELLEDGKVAFNIITNEILARAGASEEDCDGLVNIGRDICGVEVSILLRQHGDKLIKANLRSKSYVDVASIAYMFNGGGHKRAAGFTSEDRIEQIKNKVLEKVREMLR